MSGTGPSLKELARACLARHRGAAAEARPPAAPPGAGRGRLDDRPAIVDRDGRRHRAEDDVQAFERAVVEWLNRNPPAADPDRCAACGERLGAHDGLPFLRGDGGHVWLHARCHSGWARRRRAEAVAALAAAGLNAPVGGKR